MYLNSTAEAMSPERNEAANFLRERFNLAVPLSPKGENLASR